VRDEPEIVVILGRNYLGYLRIDRRLIIWGMWTWCGWFRIRISGKL
jgi:hypothetical protein